MDSSIEYADIVTEAPSWNRWLTPRLARSQPVHRWFLFPHSFTGNLVGSLIEEWGLDANDHLLDPFVGSGTTLVAAKAAGVPSTGFDISPLAILASNTKVAGFSREVLDEVWSSLVLRLDQATDPKPVGSYPELVRKALPDGRLETLSLIWSCIDEVECSDVERGFFRLALISIIPSLSLAVASGGWLRWQDCAADQNTARGLFEERVTTMIKDVTCNDFASMPREEAWSARIGDARSLPEREMTYSAVICSPPYPNRHDYTRVFGVELMFSFLDWKETRALRHQSFESHPESRPIRPSTDEFCMPRLLKVLIEGLSDRRIRRMLNGYFVDLYLCLREIARVCKVGATIALVLGNARYDGKAILVDEYAAMIGHQVSLACREVRIVRWRGNSAQQMGRFGREASRESVIIFEKI